MKKEHIAKALDEIGDKYITEAIYYKKTKKHIEMKWIVVAACICLMIGLGIDTIERFEYFTASCGAYVGEVVDGIYYYNVKSDGLYCYSPDEGNRKVLSTYWYDSYEINDYGVYYSRGRQLYIQIHDTGERKLLYRSGLFESSHIGFTLRADGNIVVTIYNRYTDNMSEILLDGKTGEELEMVMENFAELYYSESHFVIGERELTLVEAGDYYDLVENGESILPETIDGIEGYGATYIGDALWFYINDNLDLPNAKQNMFVVYPDGTNTVNVLPFFGLYSGNNDFLFWSDYEANEMWCFDVASGESWTLEKDSDLTIYSVESDGEYVYSCAPWDEAQILWKLLYDDVGRPVSLELVDENIKD